MTGRARAPAKINLSLRVQRKDASGLHPLVSLVQTIGWHDLLEIGDADEDHLEVHGADLPLGKDNLVWRAVDALRRHTGRNRPAAFSLVKRTPPAAGLGGGSADAAAALRLYGAHVGFTGDLDEPAASVGADVPFCLHGGLRWMEGYGERLSGALPSADDYWVAVAVPPFELATPRVYAAWDDLGEPHGTEVPIRAIPPSLRSYGPFVNDLYPAALSLQPALDDWRAELAARWDRPVMLSGSGPSLFGLFADRSEAEEAVRVVPAEARATAAAPPLEHGAVLDDR